MAERHHSPVGSHRKLSPHFNAPIHHEIAAFALFAKAERLKLADDLKRKRVVELAHIHIFVRDAGHRKSLLRRTAAHRAVYLAAAPCQAPSRRVLVGRPESVARPAENPDGLLRHVKSSLGTGEHHSASAFRGHGAIQQMEWVGHHARSQDVFGRERPSPTIDGIGMNMAVVAYGRRDGGQLLWRGAVEMHVPAGDEGELGSGEHAVGHHEFI